MLNVQVYLQTLIRRKFQPWPWTRLIR